jgi:xanthine dehydrogenase accessory factor
MSIFKLAADLAERGTPCAICTVVRASGSVPRHEGSKMLVGANGELLAGTIGGGEMESRALQLARDAIHDGKPRNVSYQLTDPASGDPGVCGGTVEVFIEPLLMQPTLLVIGAGHVGRALVHLAKWSGFRVVLADDRAELVTPALAPNADVYLAGALREQLSKIEFTPQTYVALVTRGYPIDVNLLPMLLQSPMPYIGVIGSKRRWLTAKQALIERGVNESDLARVHAPIGIELNAETPEEIAVSIMAEIISIRRSR